MPFPADEKDPAAFAWALALAPFYLLALLAWRGFVLGRVWGWIVTPTFGLPALSTWAAVGVLIAIAAAQPSPKLGRSTTFDDPAERVRTHAFHLALRFLIPAYGLALGWAWHVLSSH